MALHLLQRAALTALLLTAVGAVSATTALEDDALYNQVLFAGTHNSAINLGAACHGRAPGSGCTLGRPVGAHGGAFSSLSASGGYQYPVMDQRLSIRDQLDQGIRVLDFEMAAITGDWICATEDERDGRDVKVAKDGRDEKQEMELTEWHEKKKTGMMGTIAVAPGGAAPSATASNCTCEHHLTLKGHCFSCCPFIVSHGNLEQSVTLDFGYTYPDALFATVADWVRANPSEIVTLYLIVTHGNPSPSSADIVGRLRATGLLDHVWNPDPSTPWGALPSTTNPYPTLGEMRAANKTVMLAGVSWGPPVAGTHVNSTGIANAGETCEGGTPCMEGWDAVVFSQLDASNAILTAGQKAGGLTNASLVMIENLSSRRGRAADNAKYWPLPNLATDLPFQFGGNPAQASLAAGKVHVLALEAAWAQLLKPLSGSPVPNIILVDFFNTSTPKAGVPSRTLIANDMDGLVAAVGEINQARHEARREARREAKREARWEARREGEATTTMHDTKPWANGCDDGGSGGCGPPVGPKWDTWSMASSTYTYCYEGCVVDWFANNTKALGLPTYGGVVGVDHYWTRQGMPCIDGQPQEFAMQDALAVRWKRTFPTLRFLSYRILSAVPYDTVVKNKIDTDPDSVVRWRHQPGSAAKAGNDSVCYNYISGCFNDPHRINNPANNCSFPIRAAAYNWSNPDLGDWFLKEVVKPAMVHGDGIWLDGIGPDNGAYMCSGTCCGYGASNSPLVQPEIDAHCDGQAAATTKAQAWLIANGGWEAQKCFDYLTKGLPTAADSPAECAAHLQARATWGANHSNYNHVVAYGTRTGGRVGYNDDTVAGTVAAFLLMRGQHWLFSIGPNGGHIPKCPTCPADPGTLLPATAKILLSDYGHPTGPMVAVPGKSGVFQRMYEKATVSLDCNNWTPTFDEHGPA